MATPASDPNLTPALSAPSGLVSNLVDPPSRAYITITCMVIFLTLTTPIVFIRVYTRHFINRHLWWDDYTSVVAWVGLWGFAGILIESLIYGNGVDMWNVSVAHAARFSELFSNIEVVARISMFFTKLSILLLFLRIFVPPQSQKTKIFYAIWFVIWFNFFYCVALVLTVLLQCVGKKHGSKTTCIDTFSLLITASTINVLSDIVMLIIPLNSVWKLHMSRKQKCGLSIIFAVGMLAVGSSIARLAWQIEKATSPNRTVVLTNVALMAFAEQTAGIIVGCMPILPAFFRHTFHFTSGSRSSKGPSSSWRKGLSNSTSAHRNARLKAPRDPYFLNRDYSELNELETGTHNTFIETKEIAKTDDRRHPAPLPEHTVEGFQGDPNTRVVVSRSVQVESRPRGIAD
ncbi:hypothetical protein MMC07_008392 [Pseudocyphellaria aurata]|nr:hypothetical protein [Pseudocyphellaria aurata]